MSTQVTRPEMDIDYPRLERDLRSPRTLFSSFMSVLTALMTLAAMVPLFSVLWTLLVNGARHLSLALFTRLPPAPMEEGGGFGNAILGTLLMVGIATLLSVPFGILAAVYLAELGPTTRTAGAVRIAAKVLTGLPSILAGVFAYAVVVLLTGHFSAVAGGMGLAILMLPTVLLTAEEAIRMVPARMREAAFGMGATHGQVVWRVLLPTALPGLLTGVMLAVARAAGETAPLLFTALFSQFWPRILHHPLEPTASLAVLIYNFSGVPYPNQIELAWAASLVLVVLVLVMNIGGQLLSARAIKK